MNFYRKAVEGAKPENANKPFTIKDKLAYAAGDFGCNMSFALNSYLMLFWTQYMGFSNNPDPVVANAQTLAIWGVIILVLKLWDAINDPLIGGLIDAIKPKPGQSKFKPWIFWGSFALIFAGALCFVPIKTAPVWLKITICVVGYLLWDMSYTIVNVPYGSLNSVITPDSKDRASLSTWRSIGSFIANIALAIAIPMVAYNKDGELVGSILIIVGLIAGIFGVVCFQFLCRGTIERVMVDYEAQREKQKFNYFKSLGAFFKNRAAVSFTFVSICQLLAMAFMQNLSGLWIQMTFPQFAKMSGIFSMLGMLPMFLVIPFVGKIVDKLGKKDASAWPMLIGVIGGILLLTIPMESVSATLGLILWMIPSICVGLGMSVNSLVGWAMVADCIDYQEVKTGRREEGVVYATYSLGRKLAQGFGASMISFLLLTTGYIAEYGPDQAVGVNSNIRYLLGAAYLIFFALQFILTYFVYNLDKKTVEEMEEKLGRNKKVEEVSAESAQQ